MNIKKYRNKVILLIVIALCIVLGCILLQPPKLSANQINQIKMVSLPSPPKEKVITNNGDINKFVSTFNELHLSPRLSISTPAGTSVWIITSGNQNLRITMTGNIVQIGIRSYWCDMDAAEKMRTLYQSYPYPEKEYN